MPWAGRCPDRLDVYDVPVLRFPTIFFDLDGTLTDPTEGITNSVRHALEKLGLTSNRELRAFIGPPLHESFRTFCGLGEEEAKDAVAAYREYFTDRGMYENRVFDGIEDLLARLVGAGGRLTVVTSKPAVYAREIVRHFNLDRFFDGVVGSELDLTNAEKPVLVRLALDRPPTPDVHGCIMVGDREHDVIGAAANGVASIGVTYGAGDREELASAGATWIVDDLDELERTLRAPAD